MKPLTKIRLLNSFHLFNIARSVKYHFDNKNPAIISFFSTFIKKGDLCFDIGANIGRKTDLFLKLGARVIAVEPQPSCLAFLRWKYRFNKKVTIIGKGLDAQEGQKTMYLCEANSLSTFSDEWIENSQKNGRWIGLKWDKRRQIEITTLDHVIQIYGQPQFCKIDVEGYELNVLKGLSQALPMLSIEINPDDKTKIMEIVHRLGQIGSYNFNLSKGEHPTSFLFEKWLSSEEITGLLDHEFSQYRFGEMFAKLGK